MHTCTDSKDTRRTDSSSRKGREATRSSPTPRLTTSLPRASHSPTTPQPEIQRPQTPLVPQRNHNQNQPQQGPEKNLGQTWTKSHFVSKLRQNSTAGRETQDKTQLIGKECASPVMQSWLPKPPNITIQEPEDNGGLQRSPGFIRTFSPAKGMAGAISEGRYTRPRTPTKTTTGDGFLNANEKTELEERGNISVKVQSLTLRVPPSHINILSRSASDFPKSKTGGEERGIESGYLFTPSPLSPAQEASLYKSLEEEILSNLQQLSIDSDTNSSSDGNLDEGPGVISSDHLLSRQNLGNREETARFRSCTPRKPNTGHEASFDAVIAELSSALRKMEKASVEKWVTALPAGLNGKVKEDHGASSHLKVSKPSMTSSWSSLGSSMDSKETGELLKVSVERKVNECPKKQKSSLLKQRRSLKKPERVPSIYKLKLRACVQPRRDHRSDRKPSKIPKPVFYKKLSCKEGSCHRQRENDFSNETFSSGNHLD